MTYYKQLDGLRAIAIIGVMVAHWHQNSIKFELLRNLPYGTGVTLFFVISGFLITKILLDFREKNASEGKSQWLSIKSFFVRRSLRIFPIYYVTIFVVYIVGYGDISEILPWLSTYTTNLYMTIHSKYIGSFSHFWSLAVEEQFYLIWIFVIVFIPKVYLKQTILYIIVISILLLFYFKFHTSYCLANSLVICSMHTLGLGALIAYYVKYEYDKIKRLDLTKVKTILLFFVLAFTLIYVYRKPDSLFSSFKDFKNPAISVIYALMVLIAIKDGYKGLMKVILENKIMIYIGRISYGLYVYHLFMNPLYFNFLNKFIGIKTTNLGYALIFFILNLLLASISWYMIEKPINNLKKHFRY